MYILFLDAQERKQIGIYYEIEENSFRREFSVLTN